ncbi:MAG: hypothetical protein V7K41_06130 [Nostoc sp.]|uniref:hypothetical protein n=1 Tax=Nostoc sp. TaxID=1180 RepID=UPI002FF6638D
MLLSTNSSLKACEVHRAVIPFRKSALIWFVCMGELVFKGIGGQCPTPVTILEKSQDRTGYPTENRCRILDAQIWRQFRIISISH